MQAAGYYPSLNLMELLDLFSGLYNVNVDRKEILASVGLEDKAKNKYKELSGGQKQRFSISTTLINNPKIIFLDEPTTGFDPEARRQFWDLINSLRESGTTILLTTHYLDEAEALADRVAVINHGKIIEVATPATLGNRQNALAIVKWRDGFKEVGNPTELVKELSSKYQGEVPELQVIRPSLEDIYLRMIGEE